VHKNLLKYWVPSILSGLALSLSSFFSANLLSTLNSQATAFTFTTYDFVVSDFNTQEDSTAVINHSSVESSSRFYNFLTPINNGNRGQVFLGLDHSEIGMSFYNDAIITLGQFSNDGIYIDQAFANQFNLTVGNSLSFSLNGNLVSLDIAAIFLHSTTSSFPQGMAIAPWLSNYDSFFLNALIVDIVFIKTSQPSVFQSFLQSNGYSFLKRVELLNDVIRANEPEKTTLLSVPYFITLIVMLVHGFLLFNNLQKDQKEMHVLVKERRAMENRIYITNQYYAYLLSALSFIVVQIINALLIPYLNDYILVFFGYGLYFPLMLVFIFFVLGKMVPLESPINNIQENVIPKSTQQQNEKTNQDSIKNKNIN
jgi:hypothetical protein